MTQKAPHVVKQEVVKGADVVFENRLGPHVGADVEVIHSIKGIELHGVGFEVAWEEGGADAVLTRAGAFPLYVVQEDGHVRHIGGGEPIEEELVHKDFVEPVLAAGLHGTDD